MNNVPEVFKNILLEQISIVCHLWANCRTKILECNRELLRLIISLSKSGITEINNIIEDIAKLNSAERVPLYIEILYNCNNIGSNSLAILQIPPYLERMLTYITAIVKKNNYSKYMSWLINKFSSNNEMDKAIFVDIVRYLVTCSSYLNNSNKNDITPRWLIIGYLIKAARNELISGEIKQALFFDWLFYNKQKDNIMLVEPGINIIFNSIKDFSDLTMELIEFLYYYKNNFDTNLVKQIEDSINDCFRQSEAYQIIPSIDLILSEDKITQDIKKYYEKLIKYNEINNSKNNKSNSNNNSCSLSSNNQIEIINLEAENKLSSITNNKNEINSKNKVVEYDFFINGNLQELIMPNTITNFKNFRIKKHFIILLDEYTKNFMNKLKHQNLVDSKLVYLRSDISSLFDQFAHFYINIFKDEFLMPLLEDSNLKLNTKSNILVFLSLFDYLYSKINDKNEQIQNILIECIKKILIIYPQFIIKILYFIANKINMKSNVPVNNNALYKILSKISEDNQTIFKDKILSFFRYCTESLDIEMINFVLYNSFSIINPVFKDDTELIFNIVMYSDINTINKLVFELSQNKYILFEKNTNDIMISSLDLELFEQEKFWKLLSASNSIRKMYSVKDFLYNMNVLSKSLSLKTKKYNEMAANQFFNNISYCLKVIYIDVIQEKNISEIYQIFNFPFAYSSHIYMILYSISLKFENFPFLFNKIIDEYIKQINSFQDKFQVVENCLKLLKGILKFDKLNGVSILFDNENSLRNFKNKLDPFCKNLNIELDF